MEGKYVLGSVGCICVTVISGAAIAAGYDGVIITGSIAAVTGIITAILGYVKGKASSTN